MVTEIPAELINLLTTDVLGHRVTVRADGALAPVAGVGGTAPVQG